MVTKNATHVSQSATTSKAGTAAGGGGGRISTSRPTCTRSTQPRLGATKRVALMAMRSGANVDAAIVEGTWLIST